MSERERERGEVRERNTRWTMKAVNSGKLNYGKSDAETVSFAEIVC